MGAIAWTISKRNPKVANLQLLHTFAAHRRRGVATTLCNYFLFKVQFEATHFRVSCEADAQFFYESLGVKFLGKQKSGCLLAVARIGQDKVRATFGDCVYDLEDPVVRSAVNRKGKGGCVEVF